ncbi:MAG: NTP transferase domain-containing protein [Actinomycetota bacterium]
MISGVVLAAGTSSRLGRPKQLLEVAGRPLLQHVIDAATGAGLDEVIVVLGHAADAIRGRIDLPSRARIVTNADFGLGQSSSLRAGLDALSAGSEAAVILLGDQPRMTSEHIRRAVAAWRDADAAVLRATFGGVPGHPVVAARSAWDVLRSARGDEGARGPLERSDAEVGELDMGPEPLGDVDTWEQYEELWRG